jgi:hypothetical protein
MDAAGGMSADAALVDHIARGEGSSKAAMVELRGSNFSHRQARLGDDGCGGRVPQRSTEYAPHPGQSKELTGELMCYARSVAGAEWDAINAGTLGDAINPWGAEMFRTISTVAPKPRSSSRRTTAGWTKRSIGNRHATTGSTRGVAR